MLRVLSWLHGFVNDSKQWERSSPNQQPLFSAFDVVEVQPPFFVHFFRVCKIFPVVRDVGIADDTSISYLSSFRPIRLHRVNLRRAVPVGDEINSLAVARPIRAAVTDTIVRQVS